MAEIMNLALIRRSQGLTKKKVAKLIDRSPQCIHNLETGKRIGSIDVALALTKLYGQLVLRDNDGTSYILKSLNADGD